MSSKWYAMEGCLDVCLSVQILRNDFSGSIWRKKAEIETPGILESRDDPIHCETDTSNG